MRTLVALIAIAALFGAFWLLRPGSGNPGTSSDSSTSAAAERAPTSSKKASASRTHAPQRTQADTDGEPSSLADAVMVEVLVVAADTDTPIADAVVSYPDPEFDWTAIPTDRRAELQTLQVADAEAFLAEIGMETRTGADGRCRVPAAEGRPIHVCAREGERFGEARGRQGASEELVVRLRRDHTLRVRLVDADGNPVAGQPVAIERLDERGEAVRSARRPEPTDGEGRCRFAHVQRLADRTTEAQGRVRAQLVGAGGPEQTFDLLQPPEDEIVLELGPCGAITVRVLERDGRPVDPARLAEATVQLAAFAARPSEPERRGERLETRSLALGPDGTVRIEPVVFDRYFAVGSFLADHETIAGPTARQPHVEVELRQADGGAILTGRILTERGPLAAERFELQIAGERTNERSAGCTDDDGAFRVLFDANIAPGPATVTIRRGLVWERTDMELPEEIELSMASLPAGVTDLGEVTLEALPIVIAGRLTGTLPPSARIAFELEHREGDRWPDVDPHVHWDGEGGFVLRAALAAGTPVRLKPRVFDSLPVEPIEVPAGTTGIEIELIAGGEATAWFLADESTPRHLLHVWLEPEDQTEGTGRKRDHASSLAGSTMRNALHPDPHSFGKQWRSLEPGRYRLTLTSTVSDKPLLEISQLEVPSGGTCDDARLQGIDVRRLLDVAEVRFQGADGAPVPLRDAFVVITKDARDWPVVPVVEGVARVAVADEAVPVLARVPGYLAVETTVDRNGTRLTLERAPEITVRAVLPAPIPADVGFELRLVPTDERFRGARVSIPRGLDIPGGTRSAADMFAVSAKTGADGVAMLRPVLDAAHAVVARVGRTTVRDESGSGNVPAGARKVTFHPQPERLAEAIADR